MYLENVAAAQFSKRKWDMAEAEKLMHKFGTFHISETRASYVFIDESKRGTPVRKFRHPKEGYNIYIMIPPAANEHSI